MVSVSLCPGERCPDDPPGEGHHWLIEDPQGAESKGKCKHCPASRNFQNSSLETDWKNIPSDIRKKIEEEVPIIDVNTF